MSLRHQRPNDSLDLLLDTMCNTFGGIILLAVLVTLLSSQEKHQKTATASDSQEMLQRHLAVAEANLKQALQLQTLLQSKATDNRWKTQVSLLATRQQIQDEIKTIREQAAQNTKELGASKSSNPGERIRAINSELRAALQRKTEAQNSLAASKENVERLKGRLASLEKQASDVVNKSQRQLRLPKEQDTDRDPVYIIARYGRIYICNRSNGDRNETDINWTSNLTGYIADPRLGKGIDPVANATVLSTYFRELSNPNSYVVFMVFEDSFAAFIHAKQMAIQSGLNYGWDPNLISEGPVRFVRKGGTRPKIQ